VRSLRTSGIAGVILALCHFLSLPLLAAIADWNFNSPVEDADPTSGSLVPWGGTGALTLIGGVTSSFGTVGGGSNSDPSTADNSQLRIRSLPRIDAGNKSAGMEFTIATTGFQNPVLSWEQYNSRTASRYWRVLYTRDGFSWVDHQSLENTNASTWVRYRVSFADVPAVNDAPYLSIRLVQEFESSATGAGIDGYAAVDPAVTYSTAGSWWLDMISISGRMIGATNSPPTISPIADVILTEGTEAEAIAFNVADSETIAEALEVTAVAAHPDIITNLVVRSIGPERSLQFSAIKSGQTDITVRATDEDGGFTEVKFKVIVTEESGEETPNFFVFWNFNGSSPDSDPMTGNFEPALGAGALAVIGTENHTFGSVGQGRTSDPDEGNNSMVRISSFPRQGEGDKSCGIQLLASTAGMRDLVLFWDQYNSSTASRHWRVQYTTNGVTFADFFTLTNTSASTWLRNRSVSFRDVPGTANNPNFGIRLVSEFASESGYAAVSDGSNYGTAGTLWLDMVGLSGERLQDQPEQPAPPALRIVREDGLWLAWPASARDYSVEFKESWSSEWATLDNAVEEQGGQLRVPIEPGETSRFFRLRKSSVP
jgi:hypothetical protein